MSESPLDRYFTLLDVAGTDPEEIGDLFTEDAVALYGGETARGRDWIVRLHEHLISRRDRARHEWATVEESPHRLIAEWSEKGTRLGGAEYSALGRAVADLDDHGRITHLRLSFAPGGSEPERVAIGSHLEAWALANLAERGRVMAATYHPDIKFYEMGEAFFGHEQISARIDEILQMASPSLIRIDGIIRNHDFVQWEWTLVHPAAGVAHGWEVFHLDGDLIDHLVVFSPDMDVVVDGVH